VPDFAIAKLNVRVLDHQSQAKVEDLFQQMTGKESVDGYRVTTLGEFHCPPKLAAKPIQRLQQVVENANRLAGQPVTWWQDTGGACDGSKLAAWGLPNIDTLGVRGGNLHSADEYMLPDSLAASAIRTLFSVLLATKQ
jgi:glutamate carboxypeptidase